MAQNDYESPVSFASEFEYWRKQGADGELVAILAPLLARPASDPGYRAAAKLLADHPAVHVPDPEEASAALVAARRARSLVAQFGEQVDEKLVAQYAPSEAALEKEVESRYGQPPAAKSSQGSKDELGSVRTGSPRTANLSGAGDYGQIMDW